MSALARLLAARRGEVTALLALVGFTVVAVGGYGYYGLNPDRLPGSPWALQFFTISFQFFAQLHILACTVVLGVFLVGRLGWRWLPALGAVYFLSFLAEHIGTGYGVPFGGYGYTGLLGVKVGGRVPVLIPLSWFLMSVPAWLMARGLLGSGSGALGRILFAPLFLVAWDLALDPAMSFLTAYWRWEETGPYYGMPWLNLLGWYVTGVVLMTALELLAARTGLDRLPVPWAGAYYVAVALMPMGMLAASGSWLGVVVTVVGMAACVGLGVVAGRAGNRTDEVPAPSPARAR